MSNTKRIASVAAFLASAVTLITTSCSAYKGHADDSDINAVLAAYPQLKGTATDSCATCHTAGQVAESSGALSKN
jgi:predicted CxxxxCH...CXXCH cytochrome family protein